MSKKNLVIIISVILCAVIASFTLLCVFLPGGCNQKSANSKETEIEWTDALPPEDEEEPEVLSPEVVYPEKPDNEPLDADKTKPVVSGDIISANDCYSIEKEGENTVVSYVSQTSLPDFAYVYIPCENYHDKYNFLKIKGINEGTQKITVIAVYYEQYEDNRPGVTIYNNSLKEGENSIVCNLSDAVILRKDYSVALNEKLTDKKIIGFMVMLDSNPKQYIDENNGKFTFTEVSVVDDSDKDISVLYAAPSVNNWKVNDGLYDEIEINTSESESGESLNADIKYSFGAGFPYVEADIFNFRPEFSNIKMQIKGENVKNLSIALKYSLKTSSDSIGYNYLVFGTKISSGWEKTEIDFSQLEELKNDFNTTIAGSYVKNLKPVALYFYIDTAIQPTGGKGTLSVKDITFEKVVDDGMPKVTSTWAISADGMEKSNVAAGGVGTLTYSKSQGWNAVSINVTSFSSEFTTFVVKVKFYNGANNLGIALGYGGKNVVIKNSDGNTLTGAETKETKETGSDDKGEFTFYIYEIDFSKAKDVKENFLKDQAVNKILLYTDALGKLPDGSYKNIAAGAKTYKTPRVMQFVSIEFKKS